MTFDTPHAHIPSTSEIFIFQGPKNGFSGKKGFQGAVCILVLVSKVALETDGAAEKILSKSENILFEKVSQKQNRIFFSD